MKTKLIAAFTICINIINTQAQWSTCSGTDIQNTNTSTRVGIGDCPGGGTYTQYDQLTVGGTGRIRFSATGPINTWEGNDGPVIGYDNSGYFQIIGGSAGINLCGDPNGGNGNSVYFDVSGQVGIGTSPAYQLELSTNSAAKPTSSAWTVTSDMRLKKNVHDYEGGLKDILQIKPVWFTYNGEAGMPQETGVGVIAQELQKVAPYMVNEWTYYATDEDRIAKKGTNYLGVDNGAMTYMLINAVKEQQKQLEEQKQLIAELQSKVNTSTGLNEINGANGFQMNQNEPNPFTHETVVKYTLPQSVKNAQMTVYDLTGKQIVALPITEMGSSSITITSEKLAAGIYIYSIVADGKIVDSKRMVVAEK